MVCRYTWWHNGVRLDLNEEYIRPLTDGDIEITLESSLAEGIYQCEANNQYGTIYTSYRTKAALDHDRDLNINTSTAVGMI